MDFAEAYLLTKLGHPELAGWWGKLLGGASGGGGSGGGGGGSDDDGGSKPFDELTWDQVIASTKTGKYKSFTVGDMKELDLGSEGIVHMQIVGIDADELADGSGYAPLTFVSKELLETSHRMNPAKTPSSAPYDDGTGTIGGWEKCEMRTYLKDTIKPLIPATVRSGIKEVTKYSQIYNSAGSAVNNVSTTDDVWIPSRREMAGNTETSGPVYTDLFADANSRKKSVVGATSTSAWWLRSAGNVSSFNCVTTGGNNYSNGAGSSYGVALGFCL